MNSTSKGVISSNNTVVGVIGSTGKGVIMNCHHISIT